MDTGLQLDSLSWAGILVAYSQKPALRPLPYLFFLKPRQIHDEVSDLLYVTDLLGRV